MQDAFIMAGVLGALGIFQTLIHHILFFFSMRLGFNWKNATTGMIFNKFFFLNSVSDEN